MWLFLLFVAFIKSYTPPLSHCPAIDDINLELTYNAYEGLSSRCIQFNSNIYNMIKIKITTLETYPETMIIWSYDLKLNDLTFTPIFHGSADTASFDKIIELEDDTDYILAINEIYRDKFHNNLPTTIDITGYSSHPLLPSCKTTIPCDCNEENNTTPIIATNNSTSVLNIVLLIIIPIIILVMTCVIIAICVISIKLKFNASMRKKNNLLSLDMNSSAPSAHPVPSAQQSDHINYPDMTEFAI